MTKSAIISTPYFPGFNYACKHYKFDISVSSITSILYGSVVNMGCCTFCLIELGWTDMSLCKFSRHKYAIIGYL